MSVSENIANKLAKEQLTVVTEEQETAQTTTNDYVVVDESILDTKGKNAVQYVVQNTNGANVITAKIMGRIVDAAGNASPWINSTLAAADVAASGATGFALTACPFSQTAIFVESKVDGSHGAAKVFGQASKI
jgi:hypothetical protein